MMPNTESRYEREESRGTDGGSRDAILDTEEEVVLYDTENTAAWIASDTTLDLREGA